MPNEGKLSQLRRSSDNPAFLLSDFAIAAASRSQSQIRRASHYFNVQGLIIMLHKVCFLIQSASEAAPTWKSAFSKSRWKGSSCQFISGENTC